MNIDINTLSVIAGIVNLLPISALLVLWWVNKTQPGPGWWLLGTCAVSFAPIFTLLPPTPPLSSILIVGATILYASYPALLYIGIQRFFHRRERTRLLLSFLTLFTLLEIYLTCINDNLVVRQAVLALTMTVLLFIAGQAVYRNKSRYVTVTANFLATVMTAYSGILIATTLVTLFVIPDQNIYHTSTLHLVNVSVALVATTLNAFGFILLVNQRLIAENREVQEHLEVTLNTVPDAMLITQQRNNAYHVIRINDKFSALFGYTRADVIGKPTTAANSWKDPAERFKFISVLQEKGSCENYEAVFLRKDGSELIGSVSANSFQREGVHHVVAMTRDITKQKQTEATLRESEARTAAILRLCPFVVAVNSMTDGRYLEVNDAFERIYGYSRAEALGRTTLELNLWVDLDERMRLLDEIRTYGLVVNREIHVRHKSGEVFTVLVWVALLELQGKPCMISMGMDITERKANEQLLRLNQFALEQAVDEVYYIRQDGRFQYVNDAACRALEYSREELLALTVPEVDPEFTRDRWHEHWQEMKAAGALTLETVHRTRSGREYPVEIYVNFLEHEGQEYSCSICRDITLRKRAEEELARSRDPRLPN